MLLQAAADLHLDLRRCWFVGDILDDIEAGKRTNCRTILVDLGTEQIPEQSMRCPEFVARDTVHALQIIKSIEALGPEADLAYCPAAWLDVSSLATFSSARGANNECGS
jgi:D-glycero-D-manno-heptose 1,7-bisphosphate phosphatase